MISFRRREDVAPSILILISIVLLAGTLAYMLLVPPPSAAGIVTGHERGWQQMQSEIAQARQQQRQARAAIGHRLWQGDPGAVSASVLALITHQARQDALQIGSFRPQRAQMLNGMNELPFSIRITGPYPKVELFIAGLDNADSALVLRSVEFASSNTKGDAVEATLGVSAYVKQRGADV